MGGSSGGLRAVAKGRKSGGIPLSSAEEALLRAAFGRYGGKREARLAAAPIVAHYQQKEGGMWFLCQCRPFSEASPALVPVAQTHIRRHEGEGGVNHHQACDFYRDAAEQRALVKTYRRDSAEPLRLARALGEGGPALERVIEATSVSRRRPGLARLLMRLADGAGLQRIPHDWQLPPLVDQIKALWDVAHTIDLDVNTRLTEFFCTSPKRLPELQAKIAAADPKRFKRNRPHGILVARVGSAGKGFIEPLAGEAIPVRGRIALFGESPGHETKDSYAARAPYLAACVVGRMDKMGPVEVLSAYLHPCQSANHLMLMDSNCERETFLQLRSLQGWLARKRDMRVSIQKPLYDIAPDPGPLEIEESRPPAIPDFLMLRSASNGFSGKTLIVETMGFADSEYRERKVRMHEIMSKALGGARIVQHDMQQGPGVSAEARDRSFWMEAMRAMTS